MHTFRQANVDVTIEQRVDYEQVVVDTVRAGSADVGFVWLPAEPASQLPRELAVEPQLTNAVVAVCRSSHYLARRTFVSGEALSREPLVLLPRELAPALWGLVRGVRTADIRQEPSFPAIINAVRREGMVGLVPACITGAVGCAEVVHRPCEHPAPRLTLWLAWRRHEQSPLRESFVEHCRSLRELTPSALVAS